ncbi:MAG: hypothetical protein ACPL4E_03145 [Thermoproteota archaeon]
MVISAGSRGDVENTAREIGSRLELFIDDWLIAEMRGVELRLHNPVPQEVAIVFNQPWEGNTSGYVTVFKDDGCFRMYYRGSNHNLETGEATHPEFTCYAESTDGVNWFKPQLSLFEFNGSKRNNIVWKGIGTHNFTPFRDSNPNCPCEAAYKALGSGGDGLYAFKSSDGVHWEPMSSRPVITKPAVTEYAFDSQNLAFWDSVRRRYTAFFRGWRNGVRDILTCSSEDFTSWTEPEWLDYGDAPKEHLYTNGVTPYFRAPHVFIGFPMRFIPEREKTLHRYKGVSDTLLMSSRDGLHWRRWTEAFIRPGPMPERWINRNNMTAWGMLATESGLTNALVELSLYSSEGYYTAGNRLRRFTLRIDGFASVHAPYSGGELVTRPLVFNGRRLLLNYSTSAAGEVKTEILGEDGNPVPGFTMKECEELYGDEIEGEVCWKSGSDVSRLSGRVVRLRLRMRDADIYALKAC